MHIKKYLAVSLCLLLAAYACRETYEAPVKAQITGYLVVEGVVNSAPGATTLKLSRTTGLNNRTIDPETNATVSIEGEDNSSIFLNENSAGVYFGTDLNLQATAKYRLSIKTQGGKTYLSDFVAVRNNPPIDSISWKRENSTVQENGLQIYIHTHDPQDNTRYYQWEYAETWEYHANYESRIDYEIRDYPTGLREYAAVYRYPLDPNKFDSSLYFCWRNRNSSDILIGSSAKLAKDVIYQPLLYIPPKAEQLSVLYSLNVRQYSWSKEGYEFLERMRKNTEQTGSVFDAQPSTLNGNIHNIIDNKEPVIGYFSICAVQEKRFFINYRQIPKWGYLQPYCVQDTIVNNTDTIVAKGLGLIPTNVFCPRGACFGIGLFLAAQPGCVDCKLRGGSSTKPVFWPW
jgi:Domain of unknown function (DUF4249)